jgi:hypothetical protein
MKANAANLQDHFDPAIPVILRLEASAVLVGAIVAYRYLGGSWLLFALLFLLPDLSMLGYLINPRVGAWAYNAVHSYVTPISLAAATWLAFRGRLSPLWLIWIAHIAFDRLLGYGLKYRAGFGYTHLGSIGKAK